MTELGDDDDVLISAIEHYSYYARQCALIHVEQIFDENVHTTRGRLAHERVDSGDDAANRGIRTERSVPLWSDKFGLRGRADLVEFRPEPYPVEYKVGRREGIHADLQLCAQALCLEEMVGVRVRQGAIFYHATRRRHEVMFDDELRAETLKAVEAIRTMIREGAVPPAPNDARCRACSLTTSCLPSVVGDPAHLRGLQGALFHPWDIGAGSEDDEDGDK